jgi:hypothetical protein
MESIGFGCESELLQRLCTHPGGFGNCRKGLKRQVVHDPLAFDAVGGGCRHSSFFGTAWPASGAECRTGPYNASASACRSCQAAANGTNRSADSCSLLRSVQKEWEPAKELQLKVLSFLCITYLLLPPAL